MITLKKKINFSIFALDIFQKLTLSPKRKGKMRICLIQKSNGRESILKHQQV